MMSAIDWPNAGAMLAVVSVCGAIGLLILRAQLARYFVTRREHTEMGERVAAAEKRLQSVPTHADIQAIMDRLAVGQGKFDVLAARMDGIGGSIGRVEAQVDMLVRSQLERETLR